MCSTSGADDATAPRTLASALRIRNPRSHLRETGRADAMRYLDSNTHGGDLAFVLLPRVVDGPPPAPRADGDTAFLGTAGAAPRLFAPQDGSSVSSSWFLCSVRSSTGRACDPARRLAPGQ